jgi:hypothetical protein
MFSIASARCFPDTIIVVILLFGAILGCTLAWYSNPFVEFCEGSHTPEETVG